LDAYGSQGRRFESQLQCGHRKTGSSPPIKGLPAILAVLRPARRPRPAVEAYGPGLGEILSATQTRHLKLWYAGEAISMRRASHEVEQLEEGSADAVRAHPEHKRSPRPPTELFSEFMVGPLAAFRAGIAKESRTDFDAAYEALTEGCNGCHIATQFSFNAVTRPRRNPYTNQSFEAPR
jgi:hypothetical protein